MTREESLHFPPPTCSRAAGSSSSSSASSSPESSPQNRTDLEAASQLVSEHQPTTQWYTIYIYQKILTESYIVFVSIFTHVLSTYIHMYLAYHLLSYFVSTSHASPLGPNQFLRGRATGHGVGLVQGILRVPEPRQKD